MRGGIGLAIATEILTTGSTGDTGDDTTKKGLFALKRPSIYELLKRYLLAAGAFAASGTADGIVVTRPCVPVAWAAAAATAAGAAGAVSPSALRTSASSFARVSLFSFRKALAFSRPWPMRSPL